ncbi:MAG: hypothetical protein AABW92_00645 [Nanoarchaeota archaeon]
MKPVSNITYEEAYDPINQTLTVEEQTNLFLELIQDLKDNSEIIIFYNE